MTFIISNALQYRVVAVPATDNTAWHYQSVHDTLDAASAACDAYNAAPFWTDDGSRYYVTAIGGADSLSAGFNNTPPPPVN